MMVEGLMMGAIGRVGVPTCQRCAHPMSGGPSALIIGAFLHPLNLPYRCLTPGCVNR